MATETVVLTRQELYDLVWGTPMYKLAPCYGISNVGLGKLCRRMLVPTPYRGYWEKLHHGSKARRLPLRKLPDEEERKHLARLTRRELSPDRPMTEAERLAQMEKDESRRIVVQERVSRFHDIVLRTRQSLEPRQKSDALLMKSSGDDSLDVWVSKAQIPRAMRILDSLIRACEAREFRVAVDPDRNVLSVQILNEWQRFSLTESLSKTERPLTAKEMEQRARWPGLYPDRPTYTYAPSGRLVLRIESGCFGMRQVWCDRKSRRVEDQLNSFIGGLVLNAGQDLEWRQKREESERLAKLERERIAREAETKRLLKERLQRLHDDASSHSKVRAIRRYIIAVREEDQRRTGLDSVSPGVERWAKWAEEQANVLDPLGSGKGLPSLPALPEIQLGEGKPATNAM